MVSEWLGREAKKQKRKKGEGHEQRGVGKIVQVGYSMQDILTLFSTVSTFCTVHAYCTPLSDTCRPTLTGRSSRGSAGRQHVWGLAFG